MCIVHEPKVDQQGHIMVLANQGGWKRHIIVHQGINVQKNRPNFK